MQARKARKIVLAVIIALLFVSISPVVQAAESNVLIEIHLGEEATNITPPPAPPTIPGAGPNTPGSLPQTGVTVGQVSMLGILIILIGIVLAALIKEDKQKEDKQKWSKTLFKGSLSNVSTKTAR